ncbi:MAG: hypothetical protein IJI09_01650 [Clostridia bacterium]|nr:hypothetical protein [Clostridia bacterium]
MKSTPERRTALELVAATAKALNTGYQIEALDYEGCLYLTIRKPRDTEDAAYPEIYYKDDWYGTKAVGFEISTTGYGDHSLKQAQRAVTGLNTAIALVNCLYATAKAAGLDTID